MELSKMFYITFRDKIISQFMVFPINLIHFWWAQVLKFNKKTDLASPSQFGPDLQSGWYLLWSLGWLYVNILNIVENNIFTMSVWILIWNKYVNSASFW